MRRQNLRAVALLLTIAATRSAADDPKAPADRAPGTPLPVLVVDAEGRPVEGAEVVLASSRRWASLEAGGSWRKGQAGTAGAGEETVTTDPEGRFKFGPGAGRFALGAAHPEKGYGEVDAGRFAQEGRIVLRPWGRVSGRIVVDGKPVPGARVILSSDNPGLRFAGWIAKGQSVWTDPEGRFAFDRVPAGFMILSRKQGNRILSRADLEVRPGEAVEASLGDASRRPGRIVVGRFAVPEGTLRPVEFDRSGSTSIYSDRPAEPYPSGLTPEGRERWLVAWWPTEAGRAYRRSLIREALDVAPDGSFRVEGVGPGLYKLAGLFTEAGAGGQPRVVARFNHSFGVPAGPDFEPFDLGAVALAMTPPAKVVQVGDLAPPIEAKGFDGRPVRLAELRGRFVLLQFWASWSGPSIAEISHLKAARDRFADGGRLAVLGLNLDEDPGAAVRSLAEVDQPWPQAALGRPAEDPVTRAYGVEAIPSIWLIGPDGAVVAKGLRGEAIAAAVAGALGRP